MNGKRIFFAALVGALVAGGVCWRLDIFPKSAMTGTPTVSHIVPGPAPAAPGIVPQPFDFRGALETVLRETDPTKRSAAFSDLFYRWFDKDPDAALTFLRSIPKDAQFTQGLSYALQCLTKTDPERAILLAQELAITREQRFIYHAMFDRLAHDGITNALAYLEQVPAGDARENAIRTIATIWADSDVDAAFAWSKTLTDPAESAAALESSLSAMALKDPWRTFELAQDYLAGDAQDRVLTVGLKKLLADDPKQASDLISQMQPGPLQTQVGLAAARSLASDDPANAVAWLRTLPAGELQQTALNNVLDLWVKSDPDDAGQYVSAMPPGPAQDAAAAHYAKDLSAANHDDAIAWAQGLTNDSARNTAYVYVADGWARGNPADASTWAASLPADSPARAEAISASLSYWVLADTEGAGNFVRGLNEQDQPAGIRAIAAMLAQQDPQKALTWAQSFLSASSKQLALQLALERWRDNQPQAANSWAQTHGM